MLMLGNVAIDDVDRMRERLFVASGAERRRKLSAFWTLLVLAAIIASAGVVADSTATVIGAMIVAPLMTPILGTALAVVLADRRELMVNVALVVAGATVVVCVGWAVGLMHVTPVLADTNAQVAGRVSPKLIDLLAALATGVVGAFALVRSDVSDTLPGVAIAISLVPPLAVVGLTLESGVPSESLGALLLFTTNVAAIIATGTIVLLLYRVRHVHAAARQAVPATSRRTVATVVAAVLLVSVPLTWGTVLSARGHSVVAQAQPVAEQWAAEEGWLVTSVTFQQNQLRITALGSLPEANADDLRTDLDAAGLGDVDARVTLILGGSKDLPAGVIP